MALTLYTTKELLELPPPEWLIDNVFPERGLAALYGTPGAGKTFIALNMAAHVALGVPWQGRKVRQGPVVYVSAEGGTGISKRMAACLKQMGKKNADMLWLLQPITVSHGQADVDELAAAIADKMRLPYTDPAEEGSYLIPSLIVIDTLARCFMGDENQQEDMGNFVRAVDYFREEFRCAVLVVHHANLSANRERGSTAFRGAVDTLMRADRDETSIVLTCEKQKDAIEFDPIELQFIEVEGTDSVTIGGRENVTEIRKEQLVKALEHGPLSWYEMVKKSGLAEKDVNFPYQQLKKANIIERRGNLFALVGG